MKTVAIMQPTYLPWIGYFDMIDQVDCFVFLDSVQFNHRSWQQRNRIKGHDGELWLTVPVLTKGRRHQKIVEAEIAKTQHFRDDHIKTIKYFYSKAPFFELYFDGLAEIINREHRFLANLNIELIRWLCAQMGIKAELVRSSSLKSKGKSTELLVNICQELGARRYLSALGSRDYIEENNLFRPNNIELMYHDYQHPVYKQFYGEFLSHLSIIDLLLNEGPSSLSIIRQDRKLL